MKRKCSNAGKVSTPDFKIIKVLMNDIPNQLIVNWGLSLLPTGRWTMHCAGEKVVRLHMLRFFTEICEFVFFHNFSFIPPTNA